MNTIDLAAFVCGPGPLIPPNCDGDDLGGFDNVSNGGGIRRGTVILVIQELGAVVGRGLDPVSVAPDLAQASDATG